MMTSREEFEATFTLQRFRMKRYNGEYVNTDTETVWLGWQAATERAAKIVTTYQVPVGNSAAGEMAADWTMDALREIRNAIRGE
jgi:hypothetical protein